MTSLTSKVWPSPYWSWLPNAISSFHHSREPQINIHKYLLVILWIAQRSCQLNSIYNWTHHPFSSLLKLTLSVHCMISQLMGAPPIGYPRFQWNKCRLLHTSLLLTHSTSNYSKSYWFFKSPIPPPGIYLSPFIPRILGIVLIPHLDYCSILPTCHIFHPHCFWNGLPKTHSGPCLSVAETARSSLQSFFLILLGTQLGYVFYPFCTLLGSNDWVLDSGTWAKWKRPPSRFGSIKSPAGEPLCPFPSWLWLGWWPQGQFEDGRWESFIVRLESQRTVTWVRASFSTAHCRHGNYHVLLCAWEINSLLVNCNLFGPLFVNK